MDSCRQCMGILAVNRMMGVIERDLICLVLATLRKCANGDIQHILKHMNPAYLNGYPEIRGRSGGGEREIKLFIICFKIV